LVRKVKRKKVDGIHLAVTADEQPAFAGVNTKAGERVDFDLLLGKQKFSNVWQYMKWPTHHLANAIQPRNEQKLAEVQASRVIQDVQHASISHKLSNCTDFEYGALEKYTECNPDEETEI
jgi:hypothetical protein